MTDGAPSQAPNDGPGEAEGRRQVAGIPRDRIRPGMWLAPRRERGGRKKGALRPSKNNGADAPKLFKDLKARLEVGISAGNDDWWAEWRRLRDADPELARQAMELKDRRERRPAVSPSHTETDRNGG